MLSFADLLQQGAGHAWLFIPSAVVLGALHGLEPGHSKTMMAAFIIAIRGTVRQAVLLGLCATLSHTLIVWVIALGGLWLWRGLAPETIEPYLQLASGVIVLGMGSWMLWRTWREQQPEHAHGHHGHDHHHHHHDHDHHHGHGRDHSHGHDHDHAHDHDHHHDHDHGHDHAHDHDHGPAQTMPAQTMPAQTMPAQTMDERTLETLTGEHQDAHERAHADDIRRRFAGREVSNAQIALFGLTGGLVPCPGAITVLVLCLQLQKFVLGATVVLAFSVGLALTMVASGVLAALSVRHVSRRFAGFGELVRRAPYVSGAVILLIGVYLGVSGWLHLPRA